jgi:hypothetical protein
MHKAVCCFREGFKCSQAQLATYGEQFGLDRELALKVADFFECMKGWNHETVDHRTNEKI